MVHRAQQSLRELWQTSKRLLSGWPEFRVEKLMVTIPEPPTIILQHIININAVNCFKTNSFDEYILTVEIILILAKV